MPRPQTPVPHRIASPAKQSNKHKGWLYIFMDDMNGERTGKTVNIRPSEEDLILDAYQNDYPIIEHQHTHFDPSKGFTTLKPNLTIDDFGPPEPQEVAVVPMAETSPASDVKPSDANIQAAINRISVDAQKVMALKPLFPHLDEYTLVKLVLADNMSQDRKRF